MQFDQVLGLAFALLAIFAQMASSSPYILIGIAVGSLLGCSSPQMTKI